MLQYFRNEMHPIVLIDNYTKFKPSENFYRINFTEFRFSQVCNFFL